MGRVIEVVRTFIPAERWPEVQAALRGETHVSQETSQAVQGVRMVKIDDTPDEPCSPRSRVLGPEILTEEDMTSQVVSASGFSPEVSGEFEWPRSR